MGANRRWFLVCFFLLAYLFTWVCWLSTPLISNQRLRWLVLTAGQYGPFIAGAILTAIETGRPGLREFFGRILKWRFHPILLAVVLLLPPATFYAAIVIKGLIFGAVPPLRHVRFVYDVVLNFMIILFVGGPLGEEPGWRGYALPRLRASMGNNRANVVLGVLWACWHLPIWWIGGEFPILVIAVVIVAMIGTSIVFAWLYDRTGGSILACLLLHGSLCTFSVLIPRDGVYNTWAVVIWAVAVVILWCNRRRGWSVTSASTSPPPRAMRQPAE